MSVKRIICYPDPVLNKISLPVKSFDSKLDALIKDMFDTMEDAEGIGLAAIQIGVPLRISVINIDEPLVMINPEINVLESQMFPYEEGCLSLPGVRAEIDRPGCIKVTATDRKGKEFKIKAEGLLSICIQHEVDHMDGELFINKLTPLKKVKINEQLRGLIALSQENSKAGSQ